MLACTGRKVIFYDQVQRKDLNMTLNLKIQNFTPISVSKSNVQNIILILKIQNIIFNLKALTLRQVQGCHQFVHLQ